MKDVIELKNYTISDLRAWLFHNKENGLSSKITSIPRALALIENPDAREEDVVFSVIYVNGSLAGYTAAFAEELIKPVLNNRYVWGTTLIVDSAYRGKGLGYSLMQQIKESCNYRYLGLDSSEASIQLDLKLGSKVLFYKRFELQLKRKWFQVKGLKSILQNVYTFVKVLAVKRYSKHLQQQFASEEYTLEYVNLIDDQLYAFIKNNSSNDLFLRTKEKFNWILRYHFIISAPSIERVKQEFDFSFVAKHFEISAVKVLSQGEIIGFYMYRVNEGDFMLLYLYINPVYEDKVYTSIIEHVLKLKSNTCKFFHTGLEKFCTKIGFKGTHFYAEKVSLTVPVDFEVDENLSIQGGDGDMLV